MLGIRNPQPISVNATKMINVFPKQMDLINFNCINVSRLNKNKFSCNRMSNNKYAFTKYQVDTTRVWGLNQSLDLTPSCHYEINIHASVVCYISHNSTPKCHISNMITLNFQSNCSSSQSRRTIICWTMDQMNLCQCSGNAKLYIHYCNK